MATETLVSVEQYLITAYSPDCDYVDGVVLERNGGERDHSKLQMALGAWFYNRRKELGVWVYPKQRVQVKPTRFRVPDLCVFVGADPQEQVFIRAPFLCIEILSPDDRMAQMHDKIADVLEFGVRFVWLIDPRARRAWIYTAAGSHDIRDGLLRTDNPEIVVPLAEIFAEL